MTAARRERLRPLGVQSPISKPTPRPISRCNSSPSRIKNIKPALNRSIADNQELETLLAQSRQKVQLLTDEVSATRDQLRSTTDQLLAMRDDNSQLRNKTSALVASASQREQGEIRANNSMLKNLKVADYPRRPSAAGRRSSCASKFPPINCSCQAALT